MTLAEPQLEQEHRVHYQLTFAVLAIGISAYALLQSLVTPVLPTLQHDLHTTQNTVTWVLTAYLLSASIFTPIMGRIGDMIGKERVFVATLVALAVGSWCMSVRRMAWLRMFSNQMPADSVLTSSWRDSSICCSRGMAWLIAWRIVRAWIARELAAIYDKSTQPKPRPKANP